MKAAALYFALVFGTGFILGPIRQLWLVPRVGARAAELVEMPLMLAAVTLAARFVKRRFPATAPVTTGLAALTLLLAAEISLGVAMTGRTVTQVLFDRDPISGPVYYAALAAFAAMPWYLWRR